MSHVNHRRGENRRSVHRFNRDYRGWRGWKPGCFRTYRTAERLVLQRLLQGDDVVFPVTWRDNDDDRWL
jgi:hypothetical protein